MSDATKKKEKCSVCGGTGLTGKEGREAICKCSAGRIRQGSEDGMGLYD
jgi:hypothetical protein